MTADTPTGLTVLHVRLTLQLLAPEAMVHEGDVGVRVPDRGIVCVVAHAWLLCPDSLLLVSTAVTL